MVTVLSIALAVPFGIGLTLFFMAGLIGKSNIKANSKAGFRDFCTKGIENEKYANYEAASGVPDRMDIIRNPNILRAEKERKVNLVRNIRSEA